VPEEKSTSPLPKLDPPQKGAKISLKKNYLKNRKQNAVVNGQRRMAK